MTFGEIISTALINTLLGMGTVFAMLILISFVIYLFKFIPKESAAERKAKADKAETGKAGGAAKSSAPEDGDSDAGRTDLMQEEPEQGELVAVIMAAIMAAQQKEQTGIPAGQFPAGQFPAGQFPAGQVPADGQPWPYVVRSIRRRR